MIKKLPLLLPLALAALLLLLVMLAGAATGTTRISVAADGEEGQAASCQWSAAAVTGWNNLFFLGADNTPVADAIASPCLVLPAGGSLQALWLWNATTQTWSRNLYVPDGTSSIQITAVNCREVFWIQVAP